MVKVIKEGVLFLTEEQCAIRYNISQRQFQTLVKRGDMPQPILLGCNKRWSIRSLEDFESKQISKQSALFQLASRQCQNTQK